jgi:hypothetical protein
MLLAGIVAHGPEISLAIEPDAESEARAAVIAAGPPKQFEDVFKAVQSVPRFRDEYETSAVFEQRRSIALDSIQKSYLITAPVDMEYVKYDADSQTLGSV